MEESPSLLVQQRGFWKNKLLLERRRSANEERFGTVDVKRVFYNSKKKSTLNAVECLLGVFVVFLVSTLSRWAVSISNSVQFTIFECIRVGGVSEFKVNPYGMTETSSMTDRVRVDQHGRARADDLCSSYTGSLDRLRRVRNTFACECKKNPTYVRTRVTMPASPTERRQRERPNWLVRIGLAYVSYGKSGRFGA